VPRYRIIPEDDRPHSFRAAATQTHTGLIADFDYFTTPSPTHRPALNLDHSSS
jgi:hypothetical protein